MKSNELCHVEVDEQVGKGKKRKKGKAQPDFNTDSEHPLLSVLT